MASTFNARDAAVYERSMGRWSRRLAPLFLDFAGALGTFVLDVGCGTGSLLFELAHNPDLTRIAGIDASDIYIEAARAAASDPRIDLLHGDGCALPYPDASFDAALSQLVLQFVPDPAAMGAEMRRVVRPGGVVAAAVWNSSGGRPDQRMLLDTAAVLDESAARERARTFNRPMTRKGDLEALFIGLGLEGVTESSATIWMDFEDFADFWSPMARGEGSMGKYLTALPPDRAAIVEQHVRAAYESGAPDGPRHFACTAFLCGGRVPR